MNEAESAPKHRDKSIDCLKGVLILLVVIGHGISLTEYENGFLNSLIYAVHMPAFFVISGFLHDQKKWEKRGILAFTVKRIRTLLIPFLILDVFCGSLKKIYIRKWVGLNLLGILHEIVLLIPNTVKLHYWSAPSWYLPVLFISEMMLFLILKAVNGIGKGSSARCLSIIVVECIMFAAVILLYKTSMSRVILLTVTSAAAFLFLSAGYCARNLLKKKWKLSVCAVLFMILCLCALYNRKALLGTMEMKSFPVFLVGGLCGSVLLFRFSALIHSEILAFLGRNSLPIYGTHYFVRYVFKNSGYFAMPASFTTFLLYLICVILFEIPIVPVFQYVFQTIAGKKAFPDQNRSFPES